MVFFAYPSGGLFEVSVTFKGTFMGKAGQIRGSPFRVNVLAEGDSLINEVCRAIMYIIIYYVLID